MKQCNLKFPSGKTVSSLKKEAKKSKTLFGGTCKALDLLATENGINMPWGKAVKQLEAYWSKWFSVYSFKINDDFIVDVKISPKKTKSKSESETLRAHYFLTYDNGALFMTDEMTCIKHEVEASHIRLWTSDDNEKSQSPKAFGFRQVNIKTEEWPSRLKDFDSTSEFEFYAKDVEFGACEKKEERWSPICGLKKRLSKHLFNNRFPNGEHLLKFVCVESFGDNDLIIHYFTNTAVMERNPDGYLVQALERLIEEFCEIDRLGLEVALDYENALRYGWFNPWSDTLYNGFPTFVGIKDSKTGKIDGALFFDPHTGVNSPSRIASSFVEEESVPFGSGKSLSLEKDEFWNGLVYSRGASAKSIELLVESIPLSKEGQCSVLLYQNNGWDSAIYNKRDELVKLSSLSDHMPIPVSKAKREERGKLDKTVFSESLREHTLDNILPALKLAKEKNLDEIKFTEYEKEEAVTNLCHYWDSKTNLKNKAGAFRIYWWNESSGIFEACDYEEPNWETSHFEPYKDSMMVFDCEKENAFFVVVFSEKRTEWGNYQGSIIINSVGGELVYDVGTEKEKYDEAYYSMTSMQILNNHLEDAT